MLAPPRHLRDPWCCCTPPGDEGTLPVAVGVDQEIGRQPLSVVVGVPLQRNSRQNTSLTIACRVATWSRTGQNARGSVIAAGRSILMKTKSTLVLAVCFHGQQVFFCERCRDQAEFARRAAALNREREKGAASLGDPLPGAPPGNGVACPLALSIETSGGGSVDHKGCASCEDVQCAGTRHGTVSRLGCGLRCCLHAGHESGSHWCKRC